MPDKAEAARRVNACLKRQQLVPSRGEIAYAVRAKFDPANWSDFETAKGLRTSFCSHGVTDWLSILSVSPCIASRRTYCHRCFARLFVGTSNRFLCIGANGNT